MSEPALTRAAAFGAGGDEPYTRALRDAHEAVHLHARNGPPGEGPTVLPVWRYLGAASRGEERLVAQLPGPILDVGCGPGRMVAAAIRSGAAALGIDVSEAAVSVAGARGLPVLHHSVFDPLPREGYWGTALLMDGNIGIGGAPEQLLRRCAEVVHRRGWVVVEAHRDATRDVVLEGELVDACGGTSAAFPWAEVGQPALDRYAERAGLESQRRWRVSGDRVFLAYARRR